MPHYRFSAFSSRRLKTGVSADLNPSAASLAKPKGLSLRFKATLLAIAIGTLPLLSIGAGSYFIVSRLTQANTEESEQQLASEIQLQINQLMAERSGDVQIIAGLDVFADPDLRRTATQEQKNQTLDRFIKAYPIYDSIAAFDLNGDPIAQSKGKPLPNHRDRSYIQDALRTQAPVLSQPLVSASSGIFSVYAAAPIKDKETGKIIGTVRLRVPVDRLTKLAVLLNGKVGTDYYLVDRDGNVFYSSAEQVDKTLFHSSTQSDSPNAAPKHSTQSIETIFPAIAPLKATQRAGSIITANPFTNGRQLVSYIPPQKATGLTELDWQLPELNWSIVLATDTAVVFKTQRQQLLILLLGAGGSAVLVSVLATYLASRAVQPILNAAMTVEKIGQGELDRRVPVQGDDEVAMLGANINQMADQIEELLTTLKQNAAQIQHQNQVLAQLAQDEAVIRGDAKAAAFRFTAAIADTLSVERASIWLYSNDRLALTCLGQYDRRLQQWTEENVLYAEELPHYFQMLQTESTFALDMASDDSITRELLAAESVVPDTRSVLTVPIQIGFRTIGIIRCEQVKSPRIWQAETQTFLASIANLFSIVLESDYLQQEVNHVLDVVSEAEEGNLTAQARVSDRTIGLVADTFNRLVERFAQILNQVLSAADRVSIGATQQKQLVETITVNAHHQAEAVAQVLQLTQQVEQSAEVSAHKVQASSQSLRETSTTITEGQTAIDALTREITVLQEGADRIMQRMKTLGEFVGLADQFVHDQSQIAFVTQTLALNASLVAARASEQRDPRQFVVVAHEFDSIAEQVNKLAQQTNSGLTTIEQRSAQIHQVVSAVDADVQGLGELVRRFNQGVEQSNQVFKQIQAVMNTAVQVGDTVTSSNQEIMAATRAAAEAMRNIAELAMSNTDLTQQTRVQFEQMDQLAKQLLHSIQFFQLPTVIQPIVVQSTATQSNTIQPKSEATDSSDQASDRAIADKVDAQVDGQVNNPVIDTPEEQATEKHTFIESAALHLP